MGRNTSKKTTPVVEVQPEVRILPDLAAEAKAEAIAIAETDAQIALPHSVVKASYKVKYKQRAMAAGLRGKAAKRSNGDWLAQEMAKLVLTEKEKLDVDKLEALCEANGLTGIRERWPNQSKGWEGRLRMTACLVLRKLVADNQALRVPGEEDRVPPVDFVTRNETR